MQAPIQRTIAAIAAAQKLSVPGSAIEEFDKVIAELKRVDISEAESLEPLKLRVLGNITTDYLNDYLMLMFVRAGYGATIEHGNYGRMVQDCLGGVSLTPEDCDGAVVILTYRDLQFPPKIGVNEECARYLVQKESDFWLSLILRCDVPTVVVAFDFPPYRILGEYDGLVPGGLGWHIRMLNLDLASRLPLRVAYIDTEALQSRIGINGWHESRTYHLCKQPFAMEALPEVSHTIGAALLGLYGKARKVLVLDLDDTLWGGTIGDLGAGGIELGPETENGEAYIEFQTYVKNLSKRGILLAICTKNEEKAARQPFREHSGMVLKEDDISCFIANSEDKVDNLRQIAEALNIGLANFVFVDDSLVERTRVKEELPEVLVVELPTDPAYYARALENSKAFPLRSLTREDVTRVSSYKVANAARSRNSSAREIDQFLQSLATQARIEHVDAISIQRIVQLMQKTNQFRLNLSVFLEKEMLNAAKNVIAVRLADRLQDYGIVAVAITRPQSNDLVILNWVMSCRVFGRKLEHLMMDLLCKHAKDSACSKITAHYFPTKRNSMVPGILCDLGFAASDDQLVYSRSIGTPSSTPHYIQLVDPTIQLSAEQSSA